MKDYVVLQVSLKEKFIALDLKILWGYKELLMNKQLKDIDYILFLLLMVVVKA